MAKYKKTKTEEYQMAQRRMISKDFTSSYKFLEELSIQAQCLYFHLMADTDNDGFVGNFTGALRSLRMKPRYADELQEHGFIIRFKESNCAVLTHFCKMNKIPPDRYTETEFAKEFSQLILGDDKIYYLVANELDANFTELDKFGTKTKSKRTENVQETPKKSMKLEPLTF